MGDIEFAKRENERLGEVRKQYIKLKSKINNLHLMEKETLFALEVVNAKAIEYRDSTVSFIEDEIDKSLQVAFPQELYESKISFNRVRNKDVASLKLCRSGSEYIVSLQGGRLSQQLVSCSAVSAINTVRGSRMLYLDEALASADKDTIHDLSSMIKSQIDAGFQIILIEHKEGLYNSLPRMQHQFSKEYPNAIGESVVESIEYEEG